MQMVVQTTFNLNEMIISTEQPELIKSEALPLVVIHSRWGRSCLLPKAMYKSVSILLSEAIAISETRLKKLSRNVCPVVVVERMCAWQFFLRSAWLYHNKNTHHLGPGPTSFSRQLEDSGSRQVIPWGEQEVPEV